MSEPTVDQVSERNRFEIAVDGTRAGLTQYVEKDNQRIFFHTEVGDEYGGQGLAGILVRQALDQTRADGLRIVPVCPYVAMFVKRNHEYDDILDPVTPDSIATVKAFVSSQGGE